MNKRSALWFLFGIAMIVLGASSALHSGSISENASNMLITSGIVIVIFASARSLRSEEGPEKDERTTRIGAWGISYSWFLTFVSLFILFWLDYLEIVQLDARTIILVAILEMGLSARLFQWHFFQRGDVE
jgi:uncharacterized membrane protein